MLGDDSSKRSLDTADQNKLKSQATLAYYKTPHGRNIIRLFEKYICRRGFGLAPKSTLDEVAEWWKSFGTKSDGT